MSDDTDDLSADLAQRLKDPEFRLAWAAACRHVDVHEYDPGEFMCPDCGAHWCGPSRSTEERS